MSQENVDLTRRAHEAFNRGDSAAFTELMDDEVEAVPRIVGALGQTVHGRDGIRQWFEELHEVVPDLAVEVTELQDLGDVTLVEARYAGRGASSEIPFSETNWLCWRWREGKCIAWVSKPTKAEALEAVGLSE